ncbi:hypothetical protein E3T39_15145 [Cryobacterium suzukii]|uniref:GlsB/YeaQ/YmgE family stress response membrane protein n=1 Tax=Cryobacterium suzukii TaxID=1259198 RepID=A0A4R9ACA7_9MICO|nr:hypothetical protein [Cryobacterium suzukii]TFD57334.1 hypothetical protein E3T39_15145 [Cryobacterium suzukii]
MELLFVALFGALIGLGARYFLPGRSTQGSVLVPAIGTVVAAALWVALTWLGWNWAGGWIWWVSLVGAAASSVVLNLVISRRRIHADHRMLQRLANTA